ncbi:solute carrier family 22 member 16-like [Ixodes scapularis]
MADDCISLLLGNFGPWQVLLVFLVASSNFFLALNTIGSAFLLPSELPFHCSEHNATEDVDACELRRRGRCGTVVFDQTEYRSTAVEDFELVCERRWLSSLSQSLAMAGLAVGALAFGRFADRGGRRASLLLGATVHVSGCLLSLAASGVGIYALSRLVTSLGAASATALDVLLVECVAPRHRYLDSLAIAVGFCLGALAAAGLSIALPSWRALHGVMLIHGALVFSCSLLVHESPRWLLSRGRVEDAQEALRGIATFNGVHRGKIAAHIPKLLEQYEASAAEEAVACLPNLRDLLCTSRSLGLYTLFMWFQVREIVRDDWRSQVDQQTLSICKGPGGRPGPGVLHIVANGHLSGRPPSTGLCLPVRHRAGLQPGRLRGCPVPAATDHHGLSGRDPGLRPGAAPDVQRLRSAVGRRPGRAGCRELLLPRVLPAPAGVVPDGDPGPRRQRFPVRFLGIGSARPLRKERPGYPPARRVRRGAPRLQSGRVVSRAGDAREVAGRRVAAVC